MTTVDFGVSVPNGVVTGDLDGQFGHFSSYIATGITPGGILPNDIIFCVQPTIEASGAVSPYNVISGISGATLGLNANQVNALEALFSNYVENGNTSHNTQAITMIADWSIVDPTITITHPAGTTLTNAEILAGKNLAIEALTGTLKIDPNLQFNTLASVGGTQDFIDISAVPLPASAGLFMAALVVLAAFSMRKKLAAPFFAA